MAMFESCPRCRAATRAGQLVCARCGLHLDDNRLETASPQPQQPAIPPVTPKKRFRRRDRAVAGLVAGLALVGLTVAVGMAQTRVDSQVNSVGQAGLATQTSTRAAIASAIGVQVSSTSLPPTATTRRARTPIRIPTITPVPVLPTVETPPTEVVVPPTSTSAPPSPTAPAVGLTPTPNRPQLTPTAVVPSPTRPTPPSPTRVPPTATANPPRPAATAVIKEFNQWTIALGKVESRDEVITRDSDVKYIPVGKFWLVYVDARNNGSSPRSVGETLDFTLTDDKGTIYLERTERGKNPDVREFAPAFDRDYLDKQVAPGEIVRTMLVFVMSTTSQPRTLTVKAIGPDGRVSNASRIRFDIPQNR